jgi:hypothetical protein
MPFVSPRQHEGSVGLAGDATIAECCFSNRALPALTNRSDRDRSESGTSFQIMKRDSGMPTTR